MDATLSGMFILAFLIGLTGALTPGPTLVATITASLKDGWLTGPRIVSGHMLIELVIVLVIVLGIGVAAGTLFTTIIALIGGIALIFFGALTIRGSRTASLRPSGTAIVKNAYVTGSLTSAANPFFWIWWLTVGSAFILEGLQEGIMLFAAFMAGHWCADMGWYTTVSTMVSQGRTVLSERMFRGVIAGCGIFLIAFGLYYLGGLWIRP